MKNIFLFISILLFTSAVYSQTPTDTADLREKINSWLIPNSNRQITAAKVNQLFNGVANLMKAYAVDSAYRVDDTLFLTRKGGFSIIKVILGKDANFANSDLVFNADHTHDGNHKSVRLDNFGYVEMRAKTIDGTVRSKFYLDSNGNVAHTVHSAYIPDSTFHNSHTILSDSLQESVTLKSADNGFGQSIEYRRNEHSKRKDTTHNFIFQKHKITGALFKRTDFDQGLSSFTFDASGSANPNLLFYLKKLPQSASSSDSVLVRDNNGQVFTRAQTALSPVASVGNYLTMNGSQLRLGGSSIGGNTTMNVDAATFAYAMNGGRMQVTQSGSSSNPLLGVTVNTSGGGDAISVISAAGNGSEGIFVNTTFGQAIGINIRSGTRAALALANDSIGMVYTALSKSTGNIVDGIVLNRGFATSPQSIAGTGIGIKFMGVYGPFSQSLTDTLGNINAYYTDTTTGTRSSNFGFKLASNNNTQDVFTIKGNGQLQAPKYGVGTFGGTSTYNLAVDGSGNIVEVPLKKYYTSTSNATVTNTTTETTLIGSGIGGLTIMPSDFQVGATYKLTVKGNLSTDGSNPSQFNYRLKLGGTTLAATDNLFQGTGTTNRNFSISCLIVVRSVSSSGVIIAKGEYVDENDAVNSFGDGTTATIDMTSSKIFDFTVQMNNTGAGNTTTSHVFYLERLN